MKLVLNILERLYTHKVLQSSALLVLYEMVQQPEYQNQFLEFNGPEVFENCIVNEDMLDTAASSAVKAMYVLCRSEKMCKALQREVLLHNLVHMVDLFPGNKRVNKNAALMWEMVTRNKEMCSLLLQTTLIGTLVRILGIYRKAASRLRSWSTLRIYWRQRNRMRDGYDREFCCGGVCYIVEGLWCGCRGGYSLCGSSDYALA